MEQDQRKGAMCALLAAGIRMEGLLRVAIERPEAEGEVAPQIQEAFELYKKIFESVWPVAPVAVCAAPEPEEDDATEEKPEEAVQEPLPEVVIEVEDESRPEPVPAVEHEVLKLDEMIARRESADLRKAFTLNDKFLFRRTLFKGSNERFVEVLDRLEGMTDPREATAYLSGIIDMDSEDGADFMTIINAHFGVKQ